MSEKSNADVFWPNSKPTAKPPAKGSKSFWDKSEGTQSTADVLFPKHFENGIAGHMRVNMRRLRDKFGWSEKEAADHTAAHVRLLHIITGGDVGRAESLHDKLTQHLITPADDEQSEKWFVESNKGLRENHGPDADRLKARMEAALRALPEGKLLSEANLGNNPHFVLAAAETIRSQEKAAAIKQVMAEKAEATAIDNNNADDNDD